MDDAPAFEVDFQWFHIQHHEDAAVSETYGYSGDAGAVNLEGILVRPKGVSSSNLMIFMHPASTLQLLPYPKALAATGVHVLCAASRYAKNDAALIMEKVLLDLGAFVRHAKEVLGYENIVIDGWSGGGALALFYQSEAENPSITQTPAGDPMDIKSAKLIPAKAVILQAAHLSRATLLLDTIDPSISDEANPGDRIRELDIFDPKNPNKPPYSPAFIAEYRAAQRGRIDRIRTRVWETLDTLKYQGTAEQERGFVTHRTFADLRFLDPAIEPNERKPLWSYLGDPETVNVAPMAPGRFSTLRSWLSQWSIQDTQSNGLECVTRIAAPLLVIENGADDAVPQPHTGRMYQAATSGDKSFALIKGANHYYAGQPVQMAQTITLQRGWLSERGMLD
ncbi:MAG: alpha/beta hydrolase [Marinosulfonomonas sp.]|nr:alpha/beta hydrolase [Marinosulfonomonas sp.]